MTEKIMSAATREWPYGTLLLLFIALSATPSIVRLTKGSWRTNATTTNDGLYEDEDGTATEHSVIQFSSRRPFIFIWVAVAAGLAFSFLLIVATTIQGDPPSANPYLMELWQIFAAWVSKQSNVSMKRR